MFSMTAVLRVKIPMTLQGVDHVKGGELAYGEYGKDSYDAHYGKRVTSLLWDNFTRALI